MSDIFSWKKNSLFHAIEFELQCIEKTSEKKLQIILYFTCVSLDE